MLEEPGTAGMCGELCTDVSSSFRFYLVFFLLPWLRHFFQVPESGPARYRKLTLESTTQARNVLSQSRRVNRAPVKRLRDKTVDRTRLNWALWDVWGRRQKEEKNLSGGEEEAMVELDTPFLRKRARKPCVKQRGQKSSGQHSVVQCSGYYRRNTHNHGVNGGGASRGRSGLRGEPT